MGGGHDINGAKVNVFLFISPPVSHDQANLIDGIFDIFAVNPVNSFTIFTTAPRVHIDKAAVPCAFDIAGRS